jgi:energy-coupling factor transporter ATP-binding protein EcfA2
MRLTRARVTKFRSIDDSGWVTFDDVTCMVGKNESGKTAFLQALGRLRPVPGQEGTFDPVMDYPSKDYGPYRRRHADNPDVVVIAEYELTDAEVSTIERDFGGGALTSGKTVSVTKDYSNRTLWSFRTNQAVVVQRLIERAKLTEPVKAQVSAATSVEDLHDKLASLPEPSPDSARIAELIAGWTGGFHHAMLRYFERWAPRFFYFDEYSVMRGRVSVQDLRGKVANKQVDESDRTFLAFLKVGGAELQEFEDEANFERLTRSLEATANGINREVFAYWTQNKQLRVNVQVSNANPNDPPPLNAGTILNVRIFNDRHGVTVPFDERSRGFVWFFSFFAYFSDLQADAGSLILLLDEPGLSLHAKAQGDFLSFIEDRLSKEFQVIYTTHSPVLIDPRRLDRARTVEDKDNEGTVISSDVLRNDHDTVFPLQAALGYELAQTLFIGPDCLLVEGPSDLIYLQVLGEAVRGAGGEA